METKFYAKQSVAAGIATKMNNAATDGTTYKAVPSYGGFMVVENVEGQAKRRGPKPGPTMNARNLVKVVRQHAELSADNGDDNWGVVLDWTDEQIIDAMGKSKKPSGAIWAVSQAWAC